MEPGLTDTQFNQLLKLLPGVMFRQRPDLGFSFVSSRIDEFTGLSAIEWCKQPPQRFWEVVHEADVGELQKQLKHAAESIEVATIAYRVRHLVTKRVTCIREQRQAVRDGNGSLLGYDGIWLDVTRQMISEGLHSSAAWTETLARLADVLVHDFNNRMTGIHALCETFRLQIEADHPFHEGLELIQQNAIQAKEIVQRIVDLDHGKPGARKFHNLNELVDDGLELVRKIVSRHIQIETALAPESLPVYVDAVEFRQMIIKLTMNAMNAMPQGGILRFETSRHNEHPALPHRHGTWPRVPSFCLAVTDTGVGIPAHRLHGIFDPFSTAKPLSQASGVGLYTVGQFVEKHHGAISVESVETKGTTFRVWLPEADFTEADGQRDGVP
jgi:signal transduction histidine kinase